MSWWLGLDRSAFDQEIARRFAVNKDDNPRQRGPVKFISDEQRSRGGRNTVRSRNNTKEARERLAG